MAAQTSARSVRGRTASLPSRVTGAGLLLAALLALLVGFYAWTATSSGNPFNKVTPFSFKYADDDYYNLQVDGWLNGHLWVDRPVPATIAHAADPYDPKVPGDRMPDASFYDGHYYLSWGPAPALTTFLPPRLVGWKIQENLAIFLYCLFGVLFACGTVRMLVKRLVPDTRRSVLWTGYAALALGTAIPFILRRPTIYEAAITGAFFFMMAGFYVLVRETLRPDRPRTSRLALTGVLFGLALLSRPTMAFAAVLLAATAYVLRHDGRIPRQLTPDRRRALALVIGLPVAAGVLFMVYNTLRFSGPLDFGSKWQFAGRDVRHIPFNDLGNIAPALYGYVLAPLHLTLDFPFLHLPPPPKTPIHFKAGFGAEPTGAVLWAVPFTLFALIFAVRAAVRHYRARGTATAEPSVVARVVGGLVLTAAVVLGIAIYSVPGYTERYELDFLPYVVMAATIGWAALVAGAATRRRAAWWRGAGIVLAAWSALVGVAVSFTGYGDTLKHNNFEAYKTLEDAFSPLPTLATKLAGHAVLTGFRAPGEVRGNPITYKTVGASNQDYKLQPEQELELTVVSPTARDVWLAFAGETDGPGAFVVTRVTPGPQPAVTALANGDGRQLRVHLKSGLNRVRLHLSAGEGTGPAADGTPPSMWLTDVRLR